LLPAKANLILLVVGLIICQWRVFMRIIVESLFIRSSVPYFEVISVHGADSDICHTGNFF